jgi:hypothetical protein
MLSEALVTRVERVDPGWPAGHTVYWVSQAKQVGTCGGFEC